MRLSITEPSRSLLYVLCFTSNHCQHFSQFANGICLLEIYIRRFICLVNG